MPSLKEARGAAPTFAVFIIFVLLCSWAAIVGQSSGQQMVSTAQQLAAGISQELLPSPLKAS